MSTFVKQGNQWVVKEGISENSSINDCLLALGYNHNQFIVTRTIIFLTLMMKMVITFLMFA